jgi:hypothetical protein
MAARTRPRRTISTVETAPSQPEGDVADDDALGRRASERLVILGALDGHPSCYLAAGLV